MEEDFGGITEGLERSESQGKKICRGVRKFQMGNSGWNTETLVMDLRREKKLLLDCRQYTETLKMKVVKLGYWVSTRHGLEKPAG